MSSVSSSSFKAPLSTQSTATSTIPIVTVTAPLAFTTPYVYPALCADLWDLTRASVYPSSIVPVLVSDPADPRVSSCQPAGWNEVVPSLRWTYSPAVCPSGWTAYGLTTAHAVGASSSSSISTAACCSSGFIWGELDAFSIDGVSSLCYRTVSHVSIRATSLQQGASVTTTTVTTTSTTHQQATHAFTSGIQAHVPWIVQWKEEETTMLTPQPPALTSGAYIPRWVPGEAVPPGSYNEQHQVDHSWDSLIRFLEIGVPIIFVVLAVAIGLCCCSCLRARRRKSNVPAVSEAK